MVGRGSFERGLRELHGDVEVLELDGEDRPTGRRYAVVRNNKNPIADWPVWLQIPAFLVAFIALTVMLLICLGITGISLFWMWQLLVPHN